MGKLTISTGPFSIAIYVWHNQRVIHMEDKISMDNMDILMDILIILIWWKLWENTPLGIFWKDFLR